MCVDNCIFSLFPVCLGHLQKARFKHCRARTCACALVSSRLILPWTGDHGLSCTSPCEHEMVMVFLSQPIWVNVVSPLSGSLRCILFPRVPPLDRLELTGVNVQKCTHKWHSWVLICTLLVYEEQRSSCAALAPKHPRSSYPLIMMSFHCAIK